MIEGKIPITVFDCSGLGDAVKTIVQAIERGFGAVGGPLLVPVAAELGQLARDIVSDYRAARTKRVLEKAEALLQTRRQEALRVCPRTAFSILNEASWADDDILQSMWAGLLASSCSPEGDDQGAMLFIGLLRQLTKEQVRLLDHVCSMAHVHEWTEGLLVAVDQSMKINELQEFWPTGDTSRIEREINQLRVLGLIMSGIITPMRFTNIPTPLTASNVPKKRELSFVSADVTPTPLSLQLYAACKGHRGGLAEFYHSSLVRD